MVAGLWLRRWRLRLDAELRLLRWRLRLLAGLRLLQWGLCAAGLWAGWQLAARTLIWHTACNMRHAALHCQGLRKSSLNLSFHKLLKIKVGGLEPVRVWHDVWS